MIKVDYNTALSALNDAVAEKGHDYEYEKRALSTLMPDESDEYQVCAYVHFEDGEKVPSCIVGNAMHRLGLPLDVLIEYNTGVGASALVSSLEGRGNMAFTEKARLLLNSAQAKQDRGTVWGEAVKVAVERVNMRAWDEKERLNLPSDDDLYPNEL